MSFSATTSYVHDRGHPPIAFLMELLGWGRDEDEEVFAPNATKGDIYDYIYPRLGPWNVEQNPFRRRAALMEEMRVHAGFESTWHWGEGVDTTNHTSMTHLTGQETGIFQVSFDSTWLGNNAMRLFAVANGIDTPETFIAKMKEDHSLAMRYYARLVRVNVQWAGPIKRHEIDSSLSRESMMEFEELLSDGA